MKLETLQTYSVAILILGLFLAAVGGFGAYYYGSKSEWLQRQHTASVVQTVDSRVMRLLARQQALETKMDSVERQAAVPPAPPPVAVVPPKPVLTPIPSVEPHPVAAVTPKPEPALISRLEPLPVAVAPPKAMPSAFPLFEPLPIAAVPKAVPKIKVQPQQPKQPRSKPASDLRVSLTVLGLSSQQGAAFVRRLRTQRGRTVAIHVPEGHYDALDRAQAFKNVFIEADWRVMGVQEVRSRRSGRGVALSSGTFPPPLEVATIHSAMLSAGLRVDTDLDPNQRQHRAVLFVGSK